MFFIYDMKKNKTHFIPSNFYFHIGRNGLMGRNKKPAPEIYLTIERPHPNMNDLVFNEENIMIWSNDPFLKNEIQNAVRRARLKE